MNGKPQSTPHKRQIDNTLSISSPSISKNPKLMKQAAVNLAQTLHNNSPTSTVTTTATIKSRIPTTIKELTTSTSHFTLTLLIQYKYDIRQNKSNIVGQLIGYDNEGYSINITCFNEPTITMFYRMIDEGDYIKVSNGIVWTTNKLYSLCNSLFDIIISNSTTFCKLKNTEYITFCPPFLP